MDFKRKIVLFILIILSIFCLGFKDIDTLEWLEFNYSYYSFKYPSGWKVTIVNNDEDGIYPIISPENVERDEMLIYFRRYLDFPADYNQENFYRNFTKDGENETSIVESKKTNYHGAPAQIEISKHTYNGVKLKVHRMYIYIDKTIVEVGYAANTTSRYQYLAKVTEQLMDTLILRPDLMGIIKRGEIEQFQQIIDNGFNINTVYKKDRSPLISAAIHSQIPGVITLLLENGADINLRDNDDKRAFDYILENNSLYGTQAYLDLIMKTIESDQGSLSTVQKFLQKSHGYYQIMSKIFHQRREQLGNDFEKKLYQTINGDIKSCRMFGNFLIDSDHLHGQNPNPELALELFDRGLDIETTNDNMEAARLTLCVTAAIGNQRYGDKGKAVKLKEEAEQLMDEKPDLAGAFPVLDEENRAIYDSIKICSEGKGIVFDDPVLEKAIRKRIEKPTGPLTKGNLLIIKDLTLSGSNLTSIKGIKRLSNLEALSLSSTQINDIRELVQLEKLSSLTLDNTDVTDFSPLVHLDKLEVLTISDSEIENIELLSSLKRLTFLDLNNTQISDFSPLENLTELEILCLSNTSITNLQPISNLTKLTQLYIGNTPIKDIEPLEKLNGLNTLMLNNTSVKNIEVLDQLSRLRYLDLRYTDISDITPLKKLSQLFFLNLSNTQVDSIESLEANNKLLHLFLNNTEIDNLVPLSAMINLKNLYLVNTPVRDLSPLTSLQKLDHLYLVNTEVRDLSPLLKMKSIQYLDISDNDLDFEPNSETVHIIRKLRANEKMTIDCDLSQQDRRVNFEDPGLERAIREKIKKPIGQVMLSDLEPITELTIAYQQIESLEGIEHLTNLERLKIHYAGLTDIKPLSALFNLVELDLGWNNIERIGSLANLKKLTRLNLAGNDIDDISSLVFLPQLKELNLAANNIFDIRLLIELDNLIRLNLQGNQIRKIPNLAQLDQLQDLDLTANYISEVEQLTDLNNLIRLDLSYNMISDIKPLTELSNLKELNIRGNKLGGLFILIKTGDMKIIR